MSTNPSKLTYLLIFLQMRGVPADGGCSWNQGDPRRAKEEVEALSTHEAFHMRNRIASHNTQEVRATITHFTVEEIEAWEKFKLTFPNNAQFRI